MPCLLSAGKLHTSSHGCKLEVAFQFLVWANIAYDFSVQATVYTSEIVGALILEYTSTISKVHTLYTVVQIRYYIEGHKT
jgi:hypothetical protein